MPVSFSCCYLFLNRETTNNPSIINIDRFNNRFKKERNIIKKERTQLGEYFSIFVAFVVVVVFVVIPLQGSSTFKMRQYI